MFTYIKLFSFLLKDKCLPIPVKTNVLYYFYLNFDTYWVIRDQRLIPEECLPLERFIQFILYITGYILGHGNIECCQRSSDICTRKFHIFTIL